MTEGRTHKYLHILYPISLLPVMVNDSFCVFWVWVWVLQDEVKGNPKRVDFISIDVEVWYTKKPSVERGGHRTKRDIHTYIRKD